MEDGQYRFYHGPNFISEANLYEILEVQYAKNVIVCFVDQGNTYNRVPGESSGDWCRSLAMLDIS